MAAGGYGLDHIIETAGNHDTDWHLPVVGRIRRIQRPATVVETHLTADALAKVGGKGTYDLGGEAGD
jgi:hypothetical protein